MKHLCSPLCLLLFLACGPPARDSGAGRKIIQNKGSDSMVIVAVVWAEQFKAVRPDLGVAVGGGGTGSGVAGLLNHTVDIANATRRMKESEIRSALDQGFEPFPTVVGYDAPAYVLHRNNPLEMLTFEQLAEIYGEGGTIESWEQLGVEVPGCAGNVIVRVSRQDSSGTYEYLRQAILGRERDYKLGSRDMQGSKDVIELVAGTPCAIGYTGLAYAPPADVKMPCLAVDSSSPCVVPSMQSAVDGTYPVARPLIMYSRDMPQGAAAEYLDWVLSDQGQCILRQVGYAPVRPVHCP
ncbi:MAG: phosphate ABC transporter substrate-binding protein [Thermoanaerobaculia bacterium]